MNRLYFTAAAIVCSLIATVTLCAQENQPAAQARPSPPQQSLHVDFQGGSAAEYIQALRKSSPDLNIVVLGDLDKVSMPTVQLRNVDPGAALRILQHQRTNQVIINVQEDQGAAASSRVYKVIAWQKDTDTPDRHPLVLSIADLLSAGVKPADLLTAIETAIDVVSDQQAPAQIRFHEATGLLIAKGPMEQVASIEQVVQQIRDQIARESQPGNLEETLRRSEAQLHSVMQELAEAKAEREQSDRQASVLQAQNTLLKEELERVKVELNQCERLLRRQSPPDAKPGSN